MLYKDILDVNKNFQYSVNIEYDLMDPNKIKEYIPTSDVCDVLKVFIKTIFGSNRNEKRATLLIGPYGKGKSFLVLTLLRLVCFEQNKSTKILLDRIKKIDKELYDLIALIKKKKIKLLPVIIDSNYYNIEQSFLMALKKSLELFKIKDVVPDTIYDVCLKILKNWEKDKTIKTEIVRKCFKLNRINIDDLKEKLKSFDKQGYYAFERLYNCVIKGIPFNPMVNTDIVKTYEDVNRGLQKKGFSGMFIVYDEFSKTLETGNTFLSHDLKIIQDFAELANRSSRDEQLHLCCITHKTIESYRAKDEGISEDFRKIAGRFKELRFNRNLNQNYQILSFTLNKNDRYQKVRDRFIKNSRWFYKALTESNFLDEKDEKVVFNETFPLNPITEYLLIQLSEMVAQNERTMFTLISDNDEHSFNHFINNTGNGLYNADNLYNYFSNAFNNEKGEIKNIYYRCESVLDRTESDEKKKIIKTLALLIMIHDYTKLPPTAETLSLALNTSIEEIVKTINTMIDEDRLIKITKSSRYLDFAYNNTKEIDSEVEKYISLKNRSILVSDVLNKYNEESYIIPRRYNALKQINRFFKVLFIETETYMSINSFDALFEQWYCDGLVLKLIGKKYSNKAIKKKYEEIRHRENVIVIISDTDLSDAIENASKIDALENIMQRNNSISEDTRKQADMILTELVNDTNAIIKNSFNEKSIVVVSEICGKTINDRASNICESYYSKMPIVNNDMLNKKNVSSQYIKFRNEIVSRILDKNMDFSDLSVTSPEMTIYNSFYTEGELSEESIDLIKVIKKFLYKKESKKTAISPIVKVLQASPYGLKNGIIPIYMALTISSLTDAVILYYGDNEIDVNATNLEKICNAPDNYYVLLEKGSKERDDYIRQLISLFGIKENESYYLNIKNCFYSLRDWAHNLPIIVKECYEEDNFLNLDPNLIKVKNILLKYDINPRQLLIEDIPGIFGGNLSSVNKDLAKMLNVDSYIDNYIQHLSRRIIKKFIPNYKGHILSCVREWEDQNKIDYKKTVFEGAGKKINEVFAKSSQEDDSLVNQISTLVVGYRVTDWTCNNELKLLDAINQYINDSLNDNNDNNKEEMSALGKMFMNNVESIVDEFSDSISNKEKISVLNKIIEKYSGGKK